MDDMFEVGKDYEITMIVSAEGSGLKIWHLEGSRGRGRSIKLRNPYSKDQIVNTASRHL